MMRIGVIPARLEHIPAVADAMRPADRDEVWASSLLLPDRALSGSLASSALAWTGTVDGRPACMFGVAPWPAAGTAAPWLLGTAEVEANATAFLRRNRPYVAQMSATYPLLRNWVDARNRLSIRWLRWLGFTILPAEPHGPFGVPFHPFEMRRADV